MSGFIPYTLAQTVAADVYQDLVPSGWKLDASFNSVGLAPTPGYLDVGNGFFAYALMPSGTDDGRRILAFRGTEASAGIPAFVKDFLADLKDLGESQFAVAALRVNQWMAQEILANHDIELVGHSLGGALVQWAINNLNKTFIESIAGDPDHPEARVTDEQFQSQLRFTTFNAPGITLAPGAVGNPAMTSTVVTGEHHVIALKLVFPLPGLEGDFVHTVGGPPIGGPVIAHQVNFRSFGSDGNFLAAHDINAPWWNAPVLSGYQPPYPLDFQNGQVAGKFLVNLFDSLPSDRLEVADSLKVLTILGATFTLGTAANVGTALGTLLKSVQTDGETLANTFLSKVGEEGLKAGLQYVFSQAVATGKNVPQFSIDLSSVLLSSLQATAGIVIGIPVGLAEAAAQTLGDVIKDVATGIANDFIENIKKVPGALFDLGRTLGFVEYKPFEQAYAAALNDPTLNPALRPALEQAQDIVDSAGEEIVIAEGHPSNPFDAPNANPDAIPLPTDTINEGYAKAFTVFIPYAAGSDGQAIRFTLQGTAADTFTIFNNGQEITPQNGMFTLTIPEDQREISFGLQATNVIADAGFALSATLVDATGVPTHLSHGEANITVMDGTPAVTDYTIDLDPIPGVTRTPQTLQYGDGNDLGVGGEFRHMTWLMGGGNDVVLSGGGNDQLFGDTGNDYLSGGDGQDRLYGGDGNDQLIGGLLNDVLDGGAGDDVMVGDASGVVGGNDQLIGGAGDDVLLGNGGNDIVRGGDGADWLFGDDDVINNGDPTRLVGQDYLDGGAGPDRLFGGLGDDVLLGGTEDDQLYGDNVGAGPTREFTDLFEASFGNSVTYTIPNALFFSPAGGNDYLDGGDGNDFLQGDGGDDILLGGAGNDQLYGDDQNDYRVQPGNDWLDGGDGADTLVGGGGNDVLSGGAGNDLLLGDGPYDPALVPGNDSLDGGTGNDTLFGDGGDDVLSGGDGNDFLAGDDPNDIRVVGGNDVLYGGGGDDQLQGGRGNDLLYGGDGNDVIFGDQTFADPNPVGGNDLLDGGAGDDQLFGDGGNDELLGGDGNDVLVGGTGNDTLDGGAGDDIYGFNLGDGHDVITDTSLPGEGNTIAFGPGISLANLTLTPDEGAHTLTIQVGGGGDTITLLDFDLNNVDGTLVVDTLGFSGLGSVSLASLFPLPDGLVNGTAANDVISTGAGDDVIQAFAGNDTIDAGVGNDVLDGGPGDDVLKGGSGSDTYLFGIGYGHDSIQESNPAGTDLNTIQLLEGITPGDITLQANQTNGIVLKIAGATDDLTITNFLTSPSNRIDQIAFADGTMWDAATIASQLQGLTLSGTNGPDTLQGTSLNDVLTGLGGDDTLSGLAGDDVLDGGVGNDILQGGTGNDTYLFGRGYGHDSVQESDFTGSDTDTIRLLAGIAPGDVTLQADTSNGLVLKIAGATDDLTITNFLTSPSNQIDQISFADGTVWNSATILSKAQGLTITGTPGQDFLTGTILNDVLNGLGGDDTLSGLAGNDVLDGGPGNDTLKGGAGSDTYIFGQGSGHDTIQESAGASTDVDTVQMAANVAPGDVTVVRNQTSTGSDDLVLSITGTTDQITVQNFFQGTANQIEQVQFADGTVWDSATLKDKTRHVAGTDQSDVVAGFPSQDDILQGNGGSDVLYGYSGNDVLDGGTGDDLLYGGSGNDTYVFGRGAGQDTVFDYRGKFGTKILSNGGVAFEDNGDTVQMGPSVAPGDVTVGYEGNDLVLSITDTMDRLVLAGFVFNSALGLGQLAGSHVLDANLGVAKVIFADGTTWNGVTLQTMASAAPTGDAIPGNGLDLGAGANTVIGGPGNDTLTGGTGQIMLAGGLGDDNYLVYGPFNQVIEAANEGRDTVLSAVDYTLPDNVENLTLMNTSGYFPIPGRAYAGPASGRTPVFGIGNALDNQLYGNYNDNVLIGGDGNDTLEGGPAALLQTGSPPLSFTPALGLTANDGDDLLVGGRGDDTYVFEGYGFASSPNAVIGTGSDTIIDSTADGDHNKIVVSSFGFPINRTNLTFAPAALNTLMITVRLSVPGPRVGIINLANWDPTGTSGSLVVQTIQFSDGSTTNVLDLATFNGTDGDNVITLSPGNNVINAKGGNDTVTTGPGNDLITGGPGNDMLSGGTGNDVYVFNVGDGADTIQDTAAPGEGNRIQFGAGIAPADITTTQDPNTLTIHVGSGGDSIRLLNFDPTGTQGSLVVQTLQFADGSRLDLTDLLPPQMLTGTDGDDVITGTPGDDVIDAKGGNDFVNGGRGNDTINGGTGDDTLVGGPGNDRLIGGPGHDTYVFNMGDGVDTIDDAATVAEGNTLQFGTGINVGNLNLIESANLLTVTVGENGDAVRLTNFDAEGTTGSLVVQNLTFADGSNFNLGDLVRGPGTEGDDVISGGPGDDLITAKGGNDLVHADGGNDIVVGGSGNDRLEGEDGDDRLYGGSGDDTLVGGPGNDTLIGGTGRDTYVFNQGDGTDVIDDLSVPGAENTVTFGPGINAAALHLQYGGALNDTVLTIHVGSGGDALNFPGFVRDNATGPHAIDMFQFSDGTQLSYSDLLKQGVDVQGTADADTLYGTSADNRMVGFGGADRLSGGAGNDILDGGPGNDSLSGSTGEDTYIYNLGDGLDTIFDVGGELLPDGRIANNRILFGPGISINNVTFTQVAFTQDAQPIPTILVGTDGGGIHLEPAEVSIKIPIQTLQFSDGLTVPLTSSAFETHDQVIRGGSEPATLLGGSGNDTITAGSGNTTMIGGPGNDTLTGGSGNSIFYGGTGNDVLMGGSGSNTFVFAPRGNGFDTISVPLATLSPFRNTIAFGGSYGAINPSLGLGSLVIHYGDTGDEIHIEQFDRQDALGPHVIDTFQFNDRTLTYNQLIDLGFDIQGTSGDDVLTGTNVVDRFTGGAGDDDLSGGAGDDTYFFNLGDGHNTVHDTATPSEGNSIVFGAGITVADLKLTQEPDTLTIAYDAGGDAVQLADFDPSNVTGSLVVNTLQFSDGSTANLADLLPSGNANQAPTVANPLADVTIAEDSVFNLMVPGNTFVDPDAGDTLTYNATLGDNSPLPAWLAFDAATQKFTGTPDDAQVGTVSLKVTATDTGNLSAASAFALTVTNVNEEPIVAHPVADQATTQDALFTFVVPTNTFADPDAGDTLTYDASLADGHTLPAWLSFDATTQTFSGTPGSTDVDTIHVKVTATDSGSLSVTDMFGLTVNAANPVIVGTPEDDVITGGPGNDVIDALGGNDIVRAGAGNDIVDGGSGSDLLDGGPGDDVLQASVDGTWSSAFIAYNAGSPGYPGTGQIAQIAGKNRSFDVFVGGEGTDTVLGTSGDDALALDDLYSPFPQGSGPRFSGVEAIRAGDGDDIVDLTSFDFNYGDVTLDGGKGNDVLWASGGNDVLIGGKGNDSLVGGAGNDTYQFERGDGQDTILDHDATPGNNDTVAFGSNLNPSDLVLSRQADDLRIAIHGSSDQVTVQNWYGGPDNQTETIQAGNGSALVNTQVDQLIQAMATYSASSGLTWDQAIDQKPDDVQAILAASWH